MRNETAAKDRDALSGEEVGPPSEDDASSKENAAPRTKHGAPQEDADAPPKGKGALAIEVDAFVRPRDEFSFLGVALEKDSDASSRGVPNPANLEAAEPRVAPASSDVVAS
jgi:hypothetical protein